MASAVEQLTNNYETSQPVDFNAFYNAYGKDHDKYWDDNNPYGLIGSVWNFFSGARSSAEKEYQNYLSEYEFRKNQKAVAEQNKITQEREDSAVQRAVRDYALAGFNPALLAYNGNLGSVATASQAAAPAYKRASKAEKDAKASLTSSALKVIALLLLKSI